MADLITVTQLEARLRQSFTGDALAQVEGLIADASALVRHVARTNFTTSVPAIIPAVVAQMVRRALDNPQELTGENIGAYGWQAMGQLASSSGAAIYVTRAERRLIREAAGRAGVISISFDTGLLDPLSSETEVIL